MRVIPLLAVLLLAACSGAPSGSPAQTPANPPATPTAEPTQSTAPVPSTTPAAEWRVLAEGLWLPEAPFAVAAAFDQPTLEALWAELQSADPGAADPAPTVDFAREAVLYLGTSGSSSCPEQLERIFIDEGAARVYGVWRTGVPPGAACTDDLAAQGVLIAIDRSLLPAGPFVLSLRQSPVCPDCPDQRDILLVDPATD